MELPKRVNQHITETASYKIFSSCIPDHWIIRDVTERDYGIDCYIELINSKNEVSGELISIQLKGLQTINWTKSDHFILSGIKISTTNYWNKFPTPVFLCLVDIEKKEVYYCPIRSYLRENYITYTKQSNLSYKLIKNNSLSRESSLADFIKSYFNEKRLYDLERHLTTFISHYEHYQDFIRDNVGRDVFMGVETNRILYLKHFYNNLQFLCGYFDIDWEMKSLEDYFQISQGIYGNGHQIYEQQIDEVVNGLEKKLLPLLLKIQDQIVNREKEYWIVKDLGLFNVMINVRDDGSMPFDWA